MVGRSLVLAALALAGCDEVFGLTGRAKDGGTDVEQRDAAGDGASSSDGPTQVLQCGTPSDSFDLADLEKCGAWGTAEGPAQAFSRSGGRLGVVSSGYVTAFCQVTNPVDLVDGIILEVASVAAPTASDVAILRAISPSGRVSIGVHGDSLQVRRDLVVVVDIPYAAMRWWKLDADASSVRASVSADGVMWQALGQIPGLDTGPVWQIDFGVIPTEGTVAMEVASFNCVPRP